MENKVDISMFPPAEEGYERFVITMDPRENESDYQVEFYVGKTMSVDCNQHSLTGSFETLNLKGWGYSYTRFTTKGVVMSTKMGCPEGSEREAFVHSSSETKRYNSRLPIIIYIPHGYEVRYHIWSKNPAFHKAEKG